MRSVKPALKQGESEVKVEHLEAYRRVQADSSREAIKQVENELQKALNEKGFDIGQVELNVVRQRD